LLDHIDGARPRLDLPLDLKATAFQLRVWEELRKIPYGATRSYREVAEAIDQRGAARAVARACATNPVAIVTPCHRVIRGDGGLGGYRWGIGRKQALLAREAEARR
jgi:O-6-methylguanine DNA methyltransferase